MQPIEITFSYWDGSGHRRSIKCTKGSSVGQFLELARKSLQEDFRELRGVASDNLLYIKEDLIVPHDMTFHFLIETKYACRPQNAVPWSMCSLSLSFCLSCHLSFPSDQISCVRSVDRDCLGVGVCVCV